MPAAYDIEIGLRALWDIYRNRRRQYRPARIDAGIAPIQAGRRHLQNNPYQYGPSREGEGLGVRAPIDLFVCLVDHFEPQVGGARADVALRRLEAWRELYPRI